MIQFSFCPSCSSKEIRRVRRDWTGQFKGQTYVVPQLQFYECTACGEKIYDRAAMRQIEAHSPAFVKVGPRK